MRVFVTTTYQCEICERIWRTEAQAQQCEAWPPPALQVGDVVLWRGTRDLGQFQTLVYDLVHDIDQHLIDGVPGHRTQYQLGKQHIVDDYQLSDPRTGYVTLAGAVGHPGLHTTQLAVAMRGDTELGAAIEWLIAAGFPVHPRTGSLYISLRAVEYSLTWSRAGQRRVLPNEDPDTMTALKLSPEQGRILEFTARDLTDTECLAFVLSEDGLGAFDQTRYQLWAGMTDFNLNAAFDFLMHASEEQVISAVRSYRAALAAGTALFGHRDTLRQLFPINDRRSSGAWPSFALTFVKDRVIRGSGSTRLNRVRETVFTESKEPVLVDIRNDYLRIFHERPVLAVMAGKGGVGKSSVAADLARALTQVGRRVLLIDVDFYGPSQPILFPVDDPRIRTADGKMIPHVVDGVEVLSLGHLLKGDEPLMWRGPYLETLLHLFGANVASDADLVILDLPPGTGDTLRATKHLTRAHFVVVTTSSEIAQADVRRAIQSLSPDERARIIGIIDNMAYVNHKGERISIWSDPADVQALADEYHLRVLGQLPFAKQADRLPLYHESIIPRVLEALDGHGYQQVDLGVISAEATRLIGEQQTNTLTPILRPQWGLDNIAGFLEGAIRRVGGNPLDDRYRETLRAELMRVWHEIGTTPSVSTCPAGAWWADLVATITESAAPPDETVTE